MPSIKSWLRRLPIVALCAFGSSLACDASHRPAASGANVAAPRASQAPSEPEPRDTQPSDPVDEGMEALLGRVSVAELHTLNEEQQLEVVYDRLFQNAAMPGTPRPTEPSDLPAELAATGIGKPEGPWYVWDGRDGEFREPVLRYFFALRPAAGAVMLESISRECTSKKIRCWLKVLQQMDAYPRTNAAVLFVEDPDAATGRSVSMAFVEQHPEAVYPDVMPFAEPVMPGVSAADEPKEPWPTLGAPHSFGSFVAAVIVEAVGTVPDQASTGEVASAVKKRLSHYGINPQRPWRRSPRRRRRAPNRNGGPGAQAPLVKPGTRSSLPGFPLAF